ncbi:DUF3857 domain-containing transglutaminase family protein [Francisella tularensis]|uniref:DUF3857 domain-containing transglutaminase family protein n=2 Tax=Francisella tularensis TaxID=263 RepID=UPI000C9B9FFE|nr:DUF3857 domain-containing transglutaminase family protein [Francisella tularensis]AUP75529.1 transglutaminase [Francisella tularensis]MBN3685816.1 DUF3857 domain-containing transglutaminase family protein [Francisella tularensis subsp. holarctica]MWX30019.1 DUF3857 domain-containing protein [Francisella tularensis]MWX54044.1 DUF3857 domain-containing protein [Francisella tularensis]MWX87476.1 DUF3857 domain-containing protein [Francisella tularensis]
MRKIKTILLVNILFSILYINISFANFAKNEDMGANYEYVNNNIFIDNNYKVDWTMEEQINIFDETARNYYKLVQLYYLEGFERLKVIDASIENNNKKYEIDKSLIEDKNLASEINGFTNTRQISIPFKKIQVGSKIKIKYHDIIEKPILDNHFSTTLYYGSDILLKNSITTIKSKVPLYISTNDPFGVLELNYFEKDKTYYSIKLLKPINSITVNEPENSILSSKKQTWVSISTDVTYEKINETLVNKYENLIHQQIPDELLDDLQALKQQKLKTDIEIIDNVTSLIQNKITYLGDWKKIDAGIYPRTMEDIIDTGYGDCKDYSLLTIASLRYLGLSARFALVNRGEIIQEYSDKTLPSINNFNHAIVYVKGFDEKEYWIDPTNNISMTNGLFPDIANRKALILDPEGFIFTQIPNIDYKKSKIVSIFKYDLEEDLIYVKKDITLEKEAAIMFTGLELFTSKDIIEDSIYNSFLEDERSIPKSQRVKSVIPNLNSRIVKNIDFSFEYILDNPYLVSNLGKLLSLNSNYSFISPPEDSVNDIYIGPPITVIKKYIFNTKINGIDKLNSTLSTPWIDLNRKAYISKDGESIIEQQYIIKKSFLSFEDRQSEQYKLLKKGFDKSFKRLFLILS